MDMTRRDAMRTMGLGAIGTVATLAGCTTGSGGTGMLAGGGLGATSLRAGKDRYELPPLPYDTDALEPVIDRKTLEIHHDRHHAGYVKGANSTLDKLAEARRSGDFGQIKALSRGLAFNASGVVLHDLYWRSMTPNPAGGPSGALAEQISRDFGSLNACKSHFAAAAKAVEGSGWATLAWEPTLQQLLVLQIEKHQNLTVWGCAPVLVCDVWEHAYYVKYQNNRGDYVDNWMTIIDWDGASKRFEAVAGASA